MAPEPEAVTPESVPITVDVQLKTVPPIEEVGRKFKGVLLQMSWINDVGVLVMTGLGVTLTTIAIGVPVQPLAVGVTLYVTVPVLMPSVLVSIWLMTAPEPAVAPVRFEMPDTVQVYVVEGTAFGFVITMFVVSPLQTV